MKEIPLTRSKIAIVDDEDYEELIAFKWYCSSDGYAVRNIKLPDGKTRLISMHRQIMKPPKGMVVDHINHKKLDNRRENLRICTYSQNQQNRKRTINATGFKGVSYDQLLKKYQVQINGKYLGMFIDKEEAARVYNKAALELFGEFACLNDI